MDLKLFSSSFNALTHLCYVESNCILVYGILGIRKIRYNNQIVIFTFDQSIHCRCNSFYT
jgi:hypothetical protein